MKNSKAIIIIFSALMVSNILLATMLYPKSNQTNDIVGDTLVSYNDTLVVGGVSIDRVILSDNFNYTYERFKLFNQDLDSSTVIKFNEVSEIYNLDTTEEMLEWCVGQILLESGAKQYYQTNHPKEGQLVKSSCGAIGISQIMPLTAYSYLSKNVNKADVVRMLGLGCTPFEFIYGSHTRSETVELCKEWLTNETNNIVLWGYIMRSKLNSRPNILKVLISYNAGTTGMINYINGGGSLTNHDYVIGIKRKLSYVEDHLD